MHTYLQLVRDNLTTAKAELVNNLFYADADHMTVDEIREEIKVLEIELINLMAPEKE